MGYIHLELAQYRDQGHGLLAKTPFPHQQYAFAALSRAYGYRDESGQSALLVLPTGAGKTFTAARWLAYSLAGSNNRGQP